MTKLELDAEVIRLDAEVGALDAEIWRLDAEIARLDTELLFAGLSAHLPVRLSPLASYSKN